MGNKIKFYTDEHIPKVVVKGLRQFYGLMLIYQVMEAEDMENHVEFI